jgi:hypothetical protein
MQERFRLFHQLSSLAMQDAKDTGFKEQRLTWYVQQCHKLSLGKSCTGLSIQDTGLCTSGISFCTTAS